MQKYRWLPTAKISQWAGNLARCEKPWFKNFIIRAYIHFFSIDLSEYLITDYRQFKHFNHFFTRKLKPNARALASYPKTIASPADGFVSIMGKIKEGQILQAKGIDYSIGTLLGDEGVAQRFNNGSFATIYLSPKNYHRVHMPVSGTAIESIYVPGQLWPVKPSMVNKTPALFTKNERLTLLFDTEHGKLALVFVGAFIVGQIATVFDGEIPPGQEVRKSSYPTDKKYHLNKGDEVGYFCLGSTIVALWEADEIDWSQNISPKQAIRMGEMIGHFENKGTETTSTESQPGNDNSTGPAEEH